MTSVQILSSACFIWLICQYSYKRTFFCLEFELPRVQPCWFTLYQGRAEKSCLVMYLILLPHMPAFFFYGSNTDYWAKDGDNHGCVLVTLSVIFLITNLMRNPMKNCYMSLSHSVPISRVLGDSLVLFSIKMFGLFAHDQELNQDYTHSLSSD